MMSSTLPALNIAQWLFTIFMILVVGGTFALMTYGAILEIRYSGPYTIASTDEKEKWRRSIILALLRTGMLPIIALLELIFIPYTDQILFQSLFCGGIWIIAFPIAILYQRWDFERTIKRYQKLNRTLKDERKSERYKNGSQLQKFVNIFMTAELKRFMSEGYPEGNSENNNISENDKN